MRRATKHFIFLVGIFTLTFFLQSVKGEFFGLVLQDSKISPTVVKVGEIVYIDIKIKNVRKNTTQCNVTAFCGDYFVGIHELTINPKTSVHLFFELNTSHISADVYYIKVFVEETLGQQKIFDVGTITIEQNDLIIPDVPEPTPNATTQVYYNLLHLLPLIPSGAAAWLLVQQKKRNKSQDSVISEGKLPHLLNEVLKFEKKVETEVLDGKKYIR